MLGQPNLALCSDESSRTGHDGRMGVENHEYDVFLCYAWENKDKADSLHKAMKVAGLRVFQDSEMPVFDHIDTRIDGVLRGTRMLVALQTEDFHRSAYCWQELHFALLRSRSLGEPQTRVLAIPATGRVADVRPRMLRDWVLPVDEWTYSAVAAAVAAKVSLLRDTDPRRLGDAPDPVSPRWRPSIPGVVDVHGREMALWDLHDILRAGPGSLGTVAAVTGLAGQGKTAFAEHFARLFAQDYSGGVYLWRGAEPDPASVDDPDEPYLWLVDDVPGDLDGDAFRELLAPTAAGRTLLVSRHDLRHLVSESRTLRLEGLGRSSALATLTSRWPGRAEERLARLFEDRAEYRDAVALADDLAHHPQALATAAALVEDGFAELRSRISGDDRTALFQALPEDLRRALPAGHGPKILATMLRGIDELSDDGRDVLRIASIGGPAPVPLGLFVVTLAEAHGLGECEARRRADEGVAALCARFLGRRDESACLVSPLANRALRVAETDNVRYQRLRLAAVAALTLEFERARDVGRPFEVAGYLPHVRRLAAAMSDLDEWHLLNEAGRTYSELENSKAALRLYERLHAACTAALGEHHETTLAMLVGLGVAAGLHGEHDRALGLKQRAWELISERQGDSALDTLVALDNLGVAWGDVGEHQKAADIHREVYGARRETVGLYHPDTIDALTNYSIAIGRCGKHSYALRLKRAIHRLCATAYGDDHPRTVDALNNVAATLSRLPGGRAEANALLRRVRDSRVAHGNQAAVAGAIENIAATTDDEAERRELLDEAYLIRLLAQGPDSPATQRTLWLVLGATPPDVADSGDSGGTVAEVLPDWLADAEIRLDHERMDELIDLHQAALHAWEQRLDEYGPNHPSTMLAVCHLAHAALNQFDHQLEEAWVLINDSLEGLRQELGSDAPATRVAQRLHDWMAGLDEMGE
jgi:tetratricopeptide (TPR) repeat protein